MRVEGYETYDIKWAGEIGWQTDKFGQGIKKVMCAYAELVRWISINLADNPKVMGAIGNSGGSMHIGYGLALYGLEDILDIVVLTGGPPSADAVHMCYRGNRDAALWADSTMGWRDNGDYCERGVGPEWTNTALQAKSIVSALPGDLRDYHYPSTKVAFVEGELDVANTGRGRKYYDEITSEKSWVVLPSVPHGVQYNPIGAATIQETLLDGLRLAEAQSD